MSAAAPVLSIRDLAVSFESAGGDRVQAVDGFGLTLHPRQTLAVVGESGCGKTVTALSVLGLVDCPPGHIDRGEILLGDRDLLKLSPRALRRVRGKEIAMIFQEPLTSLNPVYHVGDQIIEAIRLHQSVSGREAREIAVGAMHDVGIDHPERSLRAYPHEFSGGMCQRVMVAMALACRPQVLLADEPTTALDVTIQAQLLELFAKLQRERDMAMLLITHDLGVVASVADVVCVMYAGRAVEYATVHDLFDRPFHPYTRGLFSCIPRTDAPRQRLRTVAERISSPDEFKQLPGAQYGIVPWWPTMRPPESASSDDVQLHEVEPGHWVACWRTEYVAAHPSGRPDLSFRRPLTANNAKENACP